MQEIAPCKGLMCAWEGDTSGKAHIIDNLEEGQANL